MHSTTDDLRIRDIAELIPPAEVIAELEDRFDVSIPLNDVPVTRTVAQVVAQVAVLVDGRSAT